MSDTPDQSAERTILGHPSGLYVLFFAELWERFCYYGMRALLALYVVAQFHKPQDQASVSYGAFTALIYALGIFGGYVADRVLGYRRAIITGGILMGIGEFMLMVPSENMFLLGLATLMVGNGMFKPNISSLVGKLYKPGDPRRDGGFTIFYMGINMGAFLAPIACQWISAAMGTEGHPDYRYGFMVAGIGMLFGIACFGLGGKHLQGKGYAPQGREGIGPIIWVVLASCIVSPLMMLLLGQGEYVGWILYIFGFAILCYLLFVALRTEPIQRQRMFALLILLCANVVFWMSFEQAGNSLNFFARDHVDPLKLGTWKMPFEWFQSVNAIFIVMLGPVFAAMWVWLHKRNANPSIPLKFGAGLTGVGLGFVCLITGMKTAGNDGLVGWYVLTGLYLIHTCAELCLSPVGLSMVTKLAPEKMVGMVMGSWFMSIAVGNYLAGVLSSEAGANIEAAIKSNAPMLDRLHVYQAAFWPIVFMACGAGVFLMICSKLLNKLMHGIK
jgi:POT family proton-dependent oligopeptide transporter